MGQSNPIYTAFNPVVFAEMSRHADQQTAHKFACKVHVDPSGCWLWIAGKDKDGYGIFSWVDSNGKHYTQRAHRFAFRASHGWVPALLDHLACDRKSCVNPLHCVPSSSWDNIARTNNATAVNARKTVCKRGHELSANPYSPETRWCEVCRNMGRRGPLMSTNRSGYLGVSRNSRAGKWVAKIKRGPKTYWLGRYDDPLKAGLAVKRFFESFPAADRNSRKNGASELRTDTFSEYGAPA